MTKYATVLHSISLLKYWLSESNLKSKGNPWKYINKKSLKLEPNSDFGIFHSLILSGPRKCADLYLWCKYPLWWQISQETDQLELNINIFFPIIQTKVVRTNLSPHLLLDPINRFNILQLLIFGLDVVQEALWNRVT